MEILLNKIKEYTIDGSPGVGQLIELQDIAKKEKVTRATLEKMIDQAIEANKKVDLSSNHIAESKNNSNEEVEEINPITPKFDVGSQETFVPFERPNLESARDSFDKEMLARQEKETQNIEQKSQLFENREEVVFPELNVSFENEKVEKKEIFENEMPELPNPKEELPEIVQQKELTSDFETVELEQHDISFDSKESDFSVDKPEEIKPEVETISGITFEPNQTTPIVEVEVTEEGERFVGFEEALKEQNKGAENEDILRKIINENKQAREKAERDKRTQEKTRNSEPLSSNEVKTKVENSKSSNLKSTNRDKYFKSDTRKESNIVTLQQSKTIRTFGFIALFVSVTTPFYIIVFIGCGIGINIADKYKKTISENPNLYGEEIVKAVNLSFLLFVISLIIAFIKIWA